MIYSIVFFGTDQFAATILEGLVGCEEINIIKVVTMPDRPVGRKQELQKSAVKIVAGKYGLNIEQPDNLKTYDLGLVIGDLNLVVDYGAIIPQKILDLPKHGSVNIHPSLLPKYRGPSPIQSVLLNGETKTGVSIMLMDQKMDHGPILAQTEVEIDQDDNYPTLHEKLAKKASGMLVDALLDHMAGKTKPKMQNDEMATYCQMIKREHGLVDFGQTSQQIYNQYRALIKWPGIYVQMAEQKTTKTIKLLKIMPNEKTIPAGKMIFVDDKIFIGTKDSSVQVMELQMEGKNPLNAKNFINGYKYLENHQF